MARYSPESLPSVKISSNMAPIHLPELSFANDLDENAYNSTNHHIPHDFNHKFGPVLQKIDEDIENNSLIMSALTTPTTASIKRMNALHLTSPKVEATSLRRIPQKRSATKIHPDKFQCTPKKSKTGGNENIHSGVNTPVRAFGGDTNIILDDKINSTGLKLSSSDIATNVLKEKSINRMPLTRSLSTSTPKFSPNFRVFDFTQKNIPKSTSPCKKKRILKKFQSFSPISYLKNVTERVVSPNNEVELVKKRLSFVPDRLTEGTANRKRPKLIRQKKINLEDSFPDSNDSEEVAIKKIRTVPDPLNVITEECDTSLSLEIPRNATLENDTWHDFSFTTTLDAENDKFANLINAPILNLCSENDNKIQQKLVEAPTNNVINNSQSPYAQLSSIEAADSLFSNFIENNSCVEISVPSIHSYFDALKSTSLSHSDSSKEKSQLNTSDSLDQLCKQPEILLKSPKRRDSLSLIESFITPKKNELNSGEYEKNLILHPKLPKTPPKKAKALKRLHSTRFSLDRKKIARTSYEGIDRLNILVHLENIKPALDLIFDYLSGEDLVQVSMVSKKWMHIVDNNSRAREKKMGYLRTAQPVKENIKKHTFCKTIIGKPLRIPFTLNNSSRNTSRIGASPPRSPSKFNENQSLVKNLRKDSRLSRCPRCNSFCEVISPQVPTSPITGRKPYKSPRKCLFALQEIQPKNVKRAASLTGLEKRNDSAKQDVIRSHSWCTPSSKANKSYFNISALTSSNSSDSMSLFDSHSILFPFAGNHSFNESILVNSNTAICQKCGFIFCNRCSNENHPNKNCSEIGSFSPERDEENRPIKAPIVGSKQSKRNLKRLCD